VERRKRKRKRKRRKKRNQIVGEERTAGELVDCHWGLDDRLQG
jgi:hypothetical protein